MQIVCLDLEGILVPEVWIAVARHFGVEALRLTTRDISNYDKLMAYRIRILHKEKIRLADIQRVIREMKPLPGAAPFLRKLKESSIVILLSDTFYQFATPLMKQLDNPTLLCNWLHVSNSGKIVGYQLRQKEGKRKAVQAFKKLGLQVKAVGDSYNDLTMLKAAHQGILFHPPGWIRKKHPQFPTANNYKTLLRLLNR